MLVAGEMVVAWIEISEEEFIHVLNFLCNLQKPTNKRHLDDTPETFNDNYEDLTDIVEATEDVDNLEGVGEVVISLCICPSICFGEIFQSSDEIRCRNGVLAFCTEEFLNFVLLDSEVEICGPIASSWCCGDGSLGSGVAGAVVVPIEIDVAIIVGVVVVVILWGQVDIVTSSSGHFYCAKL
jgi:hypothetical protein